MLFFLFLFSYYIIMKVIICYEIRKNSQTYNYPNLHKAINDLWKAVHVMDSVFIVETIHTPDNIIKNLSTLLDWDDYILCDNISNPKWHFSIDAKKMFGIWWILSWLRLSKGI